MSADQLQDTLADFARADGLHDFGNTLGPKKAVSPEQDKAFNDSVVGNSQNNWTDEDIVLNTAFEGKNIREMLAALKDGGATDPMKTMTNYNYKITRVKFIGTPEAEAKTGQQLAQQLNLDGSVLQVDFNHHSFLSRLKRGESAPQTRVGYIWSAATINDPASKTPPGDAIFKSGGPGITLVAHKQTSGSIVFPSGLYDAGLPTKNFVSAYDVELSGITNKVSFGRRVKESVSIKFTDPKTKRNVIIGDSKGQNSPAQLNSFIKKLLAKLGSLQARFELSTKWQQKRSGDWLQALYAALLKLMTFDPPLPATFHTFFVSHDRIAIAYAVSMGVSCLYFSEDSVYAFDNRPEESNAATKRCQEGLNALGEARKTEVRDWFFGTGPAGVGHVDGMNDTRNTAMNNKKTKIIQGCETLKQPLGELKTLTNVETTIQEILTQALGYVFLEKAFPDAKTISDGIQSKDVCANYKAYATLDSLFKQHAGGKVIPTTFYGQFQNTMVYKTAAGWKIEPTVAITNRLLKFVRGKDKDTETDIRDSFAFLPFIQNSNDTDIKELIATTFQQALSTITPEIVGTLGAKTESRKSRVLLGLKTIFKQGYVYLKTANVTDDAIFRSMATEFNAITELPGAPAAVEADGTIGPAFVNHATVKSVITSKQSIQSLPDFPPEESGEGQAGGWQEGVKVLLGTEIDFDQCADPMLYATIDYACIALKPAETELAATMKAREEDLYDRPGGRRGLYGGAPTITQTMTMTEPAVDTRSTDVINLCILLAVKRVVRDSWKLDGAPTDVITYYANGSALLSAMCELQPTADNALAVRDVISHCSFMTDADFANAFGVDVNMAGVYRLFFSALEENPPTLPPTEPAKYVLAAKDTFTALWKSLPPTTGATALSIRKIADDVQLKIADRYGIKKPAFPGVGLPLSPGAPVRTPQEVREARIAAVTAKGGKRKRRARRTRRKRRTTTP